MKLIDKQEISWLFSRPADFPCYVCKDREAVYRVTYELKYETKIKLPLCEDCIKLSAETVRLKLKTS